MTQFFLLRYADGVPPTALEELDLYVEQLVAALADALEQHDVSRVSHLLEPNLFSLLKDNYLQFTRLHKYRLSVSDIKCKRVAVKATLRFPPFANETPSGMALWPGLNFIYSQPANPKPLIASRKLMVETVGTNFADYKRQQMIADTPLDGSNLNAEIIHHDVELRSMGLESNESAKALKSGYNPFNDFPIPKRFSTAKHLKERLKGYASVPMIGDLISFIRYISAMRRFGFSHLLEHARVEYEVIYGCEATHNVSVLPIVPPVEETEEHKKTRTKEERYAAKLEELTKWPQFENRSAPHIFTVQGSFPLSADSQLTDSISFRGWRLSEFDGMRRTETAAFGKMAKLSSMSVAEIDKVHPALRLFSKDLFTIKGPKPEWHEEKKRLLRVARNRLKTGSLNDPLEDLAKVQAGEHGKPGMSPVDILLAHGEEMNAKRNQSQLPNESQSVPPPYVASSKPIGNIFDLARDQSPSDSKKL